MRSQIFTGIGEVENEVATLLEGKKCIFFVGFAKDVCFVLLFLLMQNYIVINFL